MELFKSKLRRKIELRILKLKIEKTEMFREESLEPIERLRHMNLIDYGVELLKDILK